MHSSRTNNSACNWASKIGYNYATANNLWQESWLAGLAELARLGGLAEGSSRKSGAKAKLHKS